ncbi:class I lanthipeptide [Flavobacterium sp. GCM10027622]|uniref:class I lanthipeptide n=1 Tax=unclassified Flavobacterium TaxID=196869 RepID=UPI003622A4EF
MKKQNITGELAFKKAVVLELNDDQLYSIQGGSSTGCVCEAVADAIAELTKDFSRPIIK